MVIVECPKCKQKYQVEEYMIPVGGAPVKCPKCGNVFTIFIEPIELEMIPIDSEQAAGEHNESHIDTDFGGIGTMDDIGDAPVDELGMSRVSGEEESSFETMEDKIEDHEDIDIDKHEDIALQDDMTPPPLGGEDLAPPSMGNFAPSSFEEKKKEESVGSMPQDDLIPPPMEGIEEKKEEVIPPAMDDLMPPPINETQKEESVASIPQDDLVPPPMEGIEEKKEEVIPPAMDDLMPPPINETQKEESVASIPQDDLVPPPMSEEPKEEKKAQGIDFTRRVGVLSDASPEERAKNKARRLARSLIKDILLYRSKEVEEGHANGNIKELLKDEIKKCYEFYSSETSDDIVRNETFFVEALNNIVGKGKNIWQKDEIENL